MEFAGKVALVTGASSGIGEAVTRLFAERGARVLAVGTNIERLSRVASSAGDRIAAHVADLAHQAEAERAIKTAVERFGALDILVNNASVASLGRAGDLDPAEWRRVTAIDLDAVFYASRVALPHLIERRGCIVNTGSLSGSAADYAFTAYNVAKAGVIALTRCMAIDYAAAGVRVNCVSPGFTRTPMNKNLPAQIAGALIDVIPMKRAGRVEEIAEAIAFFASDRASFITGQDLIVDGGLSAHTGQPDLPALLKRGAP